MISPERYEVKQKKSREKKKGIKGCISVGLSQGIPKHLSPSSGFPKLFCASTLMV